MVHRPIVLLLGLVAGASFVLLPAARAAVFTVVNTNAYGPGSLYQAVENSTTSQPPVTINFALLGAPPYIITVSNTMGAI